MNSTRTPKRIRPLWSLIAILLSFALIAAACGDDDDETVSEILTRKTGYDAAGTIRRWVALVG